jgi:hypothetical protein
MTSRNNPHRRVELSGKPPRILDGTILNADGHIAGGTQVADRTNFTLLKRKQKGVYTVALVVSVLKIGLTSHGARKTPKCTVSATTFTAGSADSGVTIRYTTKVVSIVKTGLASLVRGTRVKETAETAQNHCEKQCPQHCGMEQAGEPGVGRGRAKGGTTAGSITSIQTNRFDKTERNVIGQNCRSLFQNGVNTVSPKFRPPMNLSR